MTLNADEFLNMAVEGSSSTELPIPEPGEYRAVVTEVGARTFTFKKGDRAGSEGMSLDVTWQIDDEAVKEALGYQPKIRQSVLLDLTPSGGLDMGKGKNVTLGRLRDALGQNQDGRPWAPNMLNGQVAVVNLQHRIDGDKVYADIKGVRAL